MQVPSLLALMRMLNGLQTNRPVTSSVWPYSCTIDSTSTSKGCARQGHSVRARRGAQGRLAIQGKASPPTWQRGANNWQHEALYVLAPPVVFLHKADPSDLVGRVWTGFAARTVL